VIDKQLLSELMRNCRQSYQALAKKIGLTVSAIKKRYNKLVDAGVLCEFAVALEIRRFGIVPLCVFLTTDGAEDKEEFIQQLGATNLIGEVALLVDGRYINFGMAAHPEDVLRLDRLLRGMEHITHVEIDQITFPWQPTYPKLPKAQAESLTFTKFQKQVLRCLVEDPRMRIRDIARRTNFSPKRVRRVLRELEAGGKVLFSCRAILTAGEDFDCHIKITFDQKKTNPSEIIDWFRQKYPHEYWWSFMLMDKGVIFNKMVVGDLGMLEELSALVKQAPFTESVDTLIYYSKRLFPLLNEIRLKEMLDEPDV
jgi:DNA-binding Lrp family transcriptional regulator